MSVPAWAALPDPEKEPCPVCGRDAYSGQLCEECREYFKAGFNVSFDADKKDCKKVVDKI